MQSRWQIPSNLECTVCELQITTDPIEFEVQFVREGMAAPDVFHFHLACFSAWELERGLLIRASGNTRLQKWRSRLARGGRSKHAHPFERTGRRCTSSRIPWRNASRKC